MKGNDLAVLQGLALLKGPGEWAFGLHIVDRIQARDDLSWWVKINSGRGAIYVILWRLMKRGLVESRKVQMKPGPLRREYRVTLPGLLALNRHILKGLK